MSDKRKNVQFAESLHEEQLKYAPDQINMAAAADRTEAQLENADLREPGVMDEQFPTDHLTSYDEKDKEMVAKLQLQKGLDPGYTPFGKLEAKESDFKWYQKKQAVAEEAQFQLWFAKEFDLMDPAQKKRAKELYPEFYAQRKKLLKKQTKNLFNLAKLKLEGIQDFKDLQTSYLAETGRLDVGPLNNLLNPEKAGQTKEQAQKTFIRGLANPFLVFGKEAYPDTVDERMGRAENFAERANMGFDTVLGIDKDGFPPFTTGSGTNGDAQWYNVLLSGLPSGAD